MSEPVRVRLDACDHLPTVRLGAAPDALVARYGDELGDTPEGTALVVDAVRGPDGAYVFGRAAVEAIARHLSELGCSVRLDPANVRVAFPGGPTVDALPAGDAGWPVGGSLLAWVDVSSEGDAASGRQDDS